MSIPESRRPIVETRRALLGLGALTLAPAGLAASRPSVDPLALREQRNGWMREGEAALAVLDTGLAQSAFERAAAIEHRADAEVSLVRAYLQAGEYRRALAFVAHTAVAHQKDPTGSALYAWLLNAMGQTMQSRRVLAEAIERMPNDSLLEQVGKQLSSPAPAATPLLLRPPLRLAPYSGMLAKNARVVGQGVLIDDGAGALVDAAGLRRGARYWVRNAMGQVSRVTMERRLEGGEFGIVRLERRTLSTGLTRVATRPPFPGSVGHLVNFPAVRQQSLQWPLMHSGFIGSVRGDQSRALGIDPPFRSVGGPIFDATGALTGLSIVDRAGRQSMFVCSGILTPNPSSRSSVQETLTSTALPADAIYERALALVVQVLVA